MRDDTDCGTYIESVILVDR